MPFNDRLKEIRKDMKLNQKDMAQRLGVSVRTWQRYEEGSKLPDVMLLVDFALSGYNIHWILTGDGDKINGIKPTENQYLREINQWLLEENIREKRTQEWFELQFELAFPMFKEWRKKRNAKEKII